MPYFGDVLLGETLIPFFAVVDANGTPIDADSTPSVKIFDGAGQVQGNVVPTFGETGAVTSISNPNGTNCVVTANAHNLQVGQRITITGVAGHALTVNSSFVVQQVLTGNTFSINLVGNGGAAGSGGSWHTSGLYKFSITCSSGNGYAAGMIYTVLATYQVSSVGKVRTDTFQVV